MFFNEGDIAAAFYVLDKGSVKLTQLTPEGHQVVLRLLTPGDAFGGVAAFGGTTYPIGAEAVTNATALEWEGGVMAGLMERHPRLAINALRFVAARLQDMQVQFRRSPPRRLSAGSRGHCSNWSSRRVAALTLVS